MITLAKKGDLAAYRQALSYITKEDTAKKLFDESAPSTLTATAATPVLSASVSAAATPLRLLIWNWCNPSPYQSKTKSPA